MTRMAIPRWEWYARTLLRAVVDGLVLFASVLAVLLALVALS